MFQKISLFTLLIFAVIIASAQDDFGSTKSHTPKHFLGINLIPAGNGDLYTFAEIEVIEKGKYQYKWINRQDFISKALGLTKSKANPENKDLLSEYKIVIDNKHWDPIENLWRLRFDGNPRDPSDKSGWYVANPKYMLEPGDPRMDSMTNVYNKQRKMLSELGIEKFSDYAYGENALKLLKALQDEGWLKKYANGQLSDEDLLAINGEDPKANKSADNRSNNSNTKTPYSDKTINNIQRDGLDQLLNGVKKTKTKPKKTQ